MNRLLSIQVLRGLAALFVVVFHAGLEMRRLAEAQGAEPLFDHARFNVGVSLFFAISGFIMVVTCRDAFGTPGAASAFMRRRLIRILPIYWLLTALTAALYLALPGAAKSALSDPLAIPFSFLFWPFARADGDVRPIVTPGWTLNLEIYFYLVFAFGLLFRRSTGLIVTALIIGGLSALRMAGLFTAVPLLFWGDPIVLGFLIGMGIGLVHLDGRRLPDSLALGLVAFGFALSLGGGLRDLPEDALLARLSNAIPAGMILLGAALASPISGQSRLWRPLILLGDASYSLYLTHEFLLRPMRIAFERFIGATLPPALFVPLGIAASVALGLACHRWLERPMTEALRRRLDGAAAGTARRTGRGAAAH